MAQQPTRHTVEPPVHQWLVLQAYRKLAEDRGATDLLVAELANYLPTSEDDGHYAGTFAYSANWAADKDAPYDSATALIEGACEEDKGTYDYGQIDRGTVLRPLRHFWNPDGEYDSGLGTSYSALQQAQSHFERAVSNTRGGNLTNAYYWLGRCAHILCDMSVPAHVQLDPHAGDFLTGDDAYEKFVASWQHYRHTRAEDAVALEIVAYPRAVPIDFNEQLTNLFYSMANSADRFDSDDANGDSTTYGQGRYNSSACNYLDPDRTFLAVYLDPFIGSSRVLTAADYTLVRCAWSQDTALVYTPTFYNQINDSLNSVRVVYTDGSEKTFTDLEDEGDISWAVCGAVYQPQLLGQVISATGNLFELFWQETAGYREEQSTVPVSVFDPPSGTEIPAEGMLISLSCSDPNAEIWYNTLGDEPIPGAWNGSHLYTEPFLVTNTIDIPARVFRDGFTPSEIVTASYTAVARFPDVTVANTPPEIQDGDSTPSFAKKTDFGSVMVGASATREFVIENTGTGILTLSGTPPVRLTGTTADDFEVVSQPSTTVQPGDALIFKVRFTPSATGTRSATVVIPNNDADEGSFQFAIAGVGAASGKR